MISNYLKKIKEAIYGEEVRSSIHDAIEQCYKDATGHPDSVAAVVLGLSKEIVERKTDVDTERKRIDNLIAAGTAQTQEIGKTILSTSINGTSVAMSYLAADVVYDKMFNNVLSKDDDFITIPYPQQGYVAKLLKPGLYHMKFVARVSRTGGLPEVPMRIVLQSASSLDGNYEAIKTEYLVFPATSSTSLQRNVEFTFAINQLTYIKLLVTNVVDGSGSFNFGAADCQITVIDWAGKLCGSMPEVVDARIGEDGTKYSNLGEAIRNQAQGIPGNLFPRMNYNHTIYGITTILKGREFSITGTATENGLIEIANELITTVGMEKGKTYFVYGFPSGTIVTFLSETGICEETQITDANNKLTVPDGARTIVLNVAVKYKDVLNYTGTIKICNRESKTYQEQINELSTKIDAMQEIITKIVTAPQRRQ